MTTLAHWVEGARPRTLPTAIAPVLAGSAIALHADAFAPGRALLALVVALALQVGVNYANDYSDGIRGTDAQRVGPLRLVGSGVAAPAAVKRAAFTCFGVAGLAGVALVALTGQWWLLVVGAAAVAAAWFYTGGTHPYGYHGLGEVFVFVFFGLVAVTGTVYVQAGRVGPDAVVAAVSMGALACAILVANNLRDLDGDRLVGKHTLATRLGDAGTRRFYLALAAAGVLGVVALAVLTHPLALLGLAMLMRLWPAARTVARGATGRELIGVLAQTGQAELVDAVGLLAGLAAARLL